MAKLGPYELNSIMTGDARELAKAIPDNSVDLVFADPIYSNIEDYEWLAETAARVLKPNGVCLVWSNGKWHRENVNWLVGRGLNYRYDFGCVISTGSAPMNGKIISKTNRLVWLDKNKTSKMTGYLADGYLSVTRPRLNSEYHWTKNPIFSRQAIEAFSMEDDCVFDPFCGRGTFPSCCLLAKRNFLAFEIDPPTAELARQRVANTQPPLPLIYPEQISLLEQV
jgi:hypothetical protein